MKTLTVETTGVIEINFNGDAFNTDTADQNLSGWVVNAFNQIIEQLQANGCNYVHFEDDGYRVLKHTRRMGQVEEWTAELPDVFTNLEQVVNEYKAAEAAVFSINEPNVDVVEVEPNVDVVNDPNVDVVEVETTNAS